MMPLGTPTPEIGWSSSATMSEVAPVSETPHAWMSSALPMGGSMMVACPPGSAVVTSV